MSISTMPLEWIKCNRENALNFFVVALSREKGTKNPRIFSIPNGSNTWNFLLSFQFFPSLSREILNRFFSSQRRCSRQPFSIMILMEAQIKINNSCLNACQKCLWWMRFLPAFRVCDLSNKFTLSLQMCV